MEMYDGELLEAQARLRAHGRDPDDYSFNRTFHPPDPDGGGMFTIMYEVEITNAKTGKSMSATGGIGFDWVGRFEDALKDGHFE